MAAINTSIDIPNNATNGDVVIIVYGIVDIEINENSVRLFPKDGGQLWVTREWWDSPYKRMVDSSYNNVPLSKTALETDETYQFEYELVNGEMLICPACGLDVHSDFKNCPRCGAKIFRRGRK